MVSQVDPGSGNAVWILSSGCLYLVSIDSRRWRLSSLSNNWKIILGGVAVAWAGGCDPTTDDDWETDSGPVAVGNILIEPCEFDFGLVESNSINTKSFKASNVGDGMATITSIETTSPFVISANTPVEVEGGSAYQFSVRFEPSGSFGTFEANVTVASSDKTEPTVCTVRGEVLSDADGDGYASVESGGDDCDDDDPQVNPGMVEEWYDGIDSDCDGASDFDQDGDGYESEVFNSDPEAGGGDCVDVDPDISPAAEDTWYDGVDSDCGGEDDFDADQDGTRSEDYGGTDCDDSDPDVNLDGTESFNGIDDDCDGVVDDSAPADEADIIAYGDDTEYAGGSSIAVGDWDDDGVADVAMGLYLYDYADDGDVTTGDAYGAIALYMTGSLLDGDEMYGDADFTVDGPGTDTDDDGVVDLADTEFGYTMENIGDFDGDLIDDLAVSAWMHNSKSGRIYVMSGADLVSGVAADDAVMMISGRDDSRLGMGLGSGIDHNGDGYDDLVSWGVSSHRPENSLAIQYGGADASGTYAWADVDATFKSVCGDPSSTFSTCRPISGGSVTKGGTPQWGYNAHGSADLNGDGYDDVLLGDGYYDDDSLGKNIGKAWILWGQSAERTNGNSSPDGAGTTLMHGTSVKDQVGITVGVIPDVDGDGSNELWLMVGKTGDMHFFYGGADLENGNLDADDAAAVMEFGSSPDTITSITSPGDWTGDGVDDVLVAFGEDNYVFLYETTAWSGTYDGERAISGSLEGGDDNNNFGWHAPRHQGDIDGDGSMDLFLGDAGYMDEDSGYGGAVFVYYNPY